MRVCVHVLYGRPDREITLKSTRRPSKAIRMTEASSDQYGSSRKLRAEPILIDRVRVWVAAYIGGPRDGSSNRLRAGWVRSQSHSKLCHERTRHGHY